MGHFARPLTAKPGATEALTPPTLIHTFSRVLAPDAYGYRQAFCADTCGWCHIDETGQPLYGERYLSVLPFREDAAAVRQGPGQAFHIGFDGRPIYRWGYDDVGNFHGGAATAQSGSQAFHIDRAGAPLYDARFASVGPVSGERAFARLLDGRDAVIDRHGNFIREI